MALSAQFLFFTTEVLVRVDLNAIDLRFKIT
jgi:hypothetical protein